MSEDPSNSSVAGEAGPLGEARAAMAVTFRQLFYPHPAQVALVALDGTILAVNEAWDRSARENGASAGYEFVGKDYLAACEPGVEAAVPGAREAYVGLLDVLRNRRPKFTLTYACHSPAQQQWYRMWVEPQTPTVAAVIVAHQLVSAKAWPPGECFPERSVPPSGRFDRPRMISSPNNSRRITLGHRFLAGPLPVLAEVRPVIPPRPSRFRLIRR